MPTRTSLRGDPIIESLLDNDFYQFTMGQVIFDRFRGVDVTYEVIVRDVTMRMRDNVDLAELEDELQHVCSLRFLEAEVAFLREMEFFSEDYLRFLRGLRLPKPEIERVGSEELRIRVTGPWEAGIFWETPMLAIIQELFGRKLIQQEGIAESDVIDEGLKRLYAKIDYLNGYPGLEFLEFGSRRRFSTEWQREVVRTFLERQRFGQLAATSNVKLAFDLGNVKAGGTMAHQLFMVTAALEVAAGTDNPLAVAQDKVLGAWEAQYAGVAENRLLIALPDTYGTPFFLEHFSKERAELWIGLRQDSGKPPKEIMAFVEYYRRMEIDPMSRLAFPSDGLTAKSMADLFARFQKTIIPTRFGCGGHIVHDLGRPMLSVVMKPVLANGQPVVKLSNDLGKATGPREAIEQYIELANYRGILPEPTRR